LTCFGEICRDFRQIPEIWPTFFYRYRDEAPSCLAENEKPDLTLTCFSRTHILTSRWKSSGLLATFSAAILAKALPQDPEPITATRCFPEGNGDGGRDGVGDEGRVAAGVVTVEPISSSANSLVGEEAEDDIMDIVIVGRRSSC